MLENEQDITKVAGNDGSDVACKRVSPRNCDELSRLLELAGRRGEYVIIGLPCAIPAGFNGRQFLFVDLSHFSQVLEHCREDQVISVESGITVAQLDKLLAQEKQWWPVAAFSPAATVAELINSGDGGCLEHQFGGPRDLVLGLSAALSTGDLISCGGKVVKNVTGYDLQKLFIGSHGWLGVVCRAHLRLFARPECSRSLVGYATALGDAFTAFGLLMRSGVPLSCLELVDKSVLELLSADIGEAIQLTPAQAGSLRSAPYAVLIQLHGKAAIVDEIEKEIRNCLKHVKIDLEALTAPVFEHMWRQLSSLTASSGLPKLELSLSVEQMADLLAVLSRQSLDFFWQGRPSRGRLQLYAKQAEMLPLLSEKIRRWSLQAEQAVVTACADQNYLWRVTRLPNEDDHAVALKKAIKARFDPSGCLNPLVAL
jgi:FAD/FMN-containing dehydrogenase